ncbi:hypothetical protein L3Q82_005907 [Scortum barcoo]|uniref:Uncharacterized protein n=1 Tax=Scortum barcoo TaxID=214431 RepID=A0ACB8V8X2_9TELE|nr:hypothetical protein L3Q82_005907 [Scortum barcoo]
MQAVGRGVPPPVLSQTHCPVQPHCKFSNYSVFRALHFEQGSLWGTGKHSLWGIGKHSLWGTGKVEASRLVFRLEAGRLECRLEACRLEAGMQTGSWLAEAEAWAGGQLDGAQAGVTAEVAKTIKRYKETGSHEDRSRKGRPRVTSAAEDKFIRLTSLRNRRLSTARALQNDLQRATGVNVSTQTIRNRLHEGGLRARRPVVGPVLTAQHHGARLAFAEEHQNWQVHHWRPVLFTDESRFTLSTCDIDVKESGEDKEERYAACNVVQHDRFGGGSVIVWGGISMEGRTDLYCLGNGSLTAIRYRDEILQPIVRPYAGAAANSHCIATNNAGSNTSRKLY